MVRKAYPEASVDVKEALARDTFTDAINEADMEWTIFQGKPRGINDALRLSLEYEAFQLCGSRRVGPKYALHSTCQGGDDYKMGGIDSNHSGSQDIATILQNMTERLSLVETRIEYPNKSEER